MGNCEERPALDCQDFSLLMKNFAIPSGSLALFFFFRGGDEVGLEELADFEDGLFFALLLGFTVAMASSFARERSCAKWKSLCSSFVISKAFCLILSRSMLKSSSLATSCSWASI